MLPRNTWLIFLVMATACLLQPGVGGRGVQMFRETPSSVQVVAGADLELRCVVDNQQGKVQWTKDGFALGFERDVPGYPRYSYDGEPSIGEHHLIIRGATLEDDGEYQCQVGPTLTTTPMWAAANLTVMVPPESITVTGKGGETVEEGSLEVVGGASVTLLCVVPDARPAPKIAWFRDGMQLDPGLHEDTIEPSERARLVTGVSRLIVTTKDEDDGVQFSCQATHPALPGLQQSLVDSISLSVLHAPSAPVISGYRTREVLRAGEKRTLYCKVTGGNPPPKVTWYWHERPHAHARKTIALRGQILSKKSKRRPGLTVSYLLTASRAVDEATYECKVTSELLEQPLSANVTLTVHYAPAKVSISAPKRVTVDQQYKVECRTSPANPPANIAWTLQGKPVDASSPPITTRDEGGGWVTSSSLTQVASKSHLASEMLVKCEARHSAAEATTDTTATITVIRSPGKPILEADQRSKVVAGTILELTCTTSGGYPQPKVKISKDGEELEGELEFDGDVTRLRVSFKVVAADNGAKAKCSVTNPATPIPLTATTTINTLFPAWEVTGSVRPVNVEVGEKMILSCKTSPSLPPSTLTWRSGGATLEGATASQSQGAFGGTITRSELVVRATAEHNGRVFTCDADNGLGVPVAANVTLSVLHGPVWVVVPEGRVDVVEGEDLVITATAAANPGPVRYRWRFGRGEDLRTSGRKGSSNGQLRLSKVTRKQSGNYSVTATSPRGNISRHFKLNVLFGPEDVLVSSRVTVDKEGTAALLCSAVGNPVPNITWTKTQDKWKPGLKEGIGEAKLVVEWASREDTGYYYCHAFSNVSRTPPVPSSILVLQAPWWPGGSSEPKGGWWAALGGRGWLECRVKAAPPPECSWTRGDGRKLISNELYTVKEPQLLDDLVEWSCVLEVNRVTRQDYADYTCTAVNTMGVHTSTHTLRPPPTPATPLHFKVANMTTDAAVLTWEVNPKGGHPSGYTIRYWVKGTRDFQLLNVSGENLTSARIEQLRSDTLYSFSLQAFNQEGSSLYTTPLTGTVPPAATAGMRGSASSSSSSSSTEDSSTNNRSSRVPRLLLLILTLAGTALLALNMAIIACFVRRRSNASHRAISASSSKTTTLEVFTPATTPAGPPHHQLDELPLTVALDFPSNTLQQQGHQTVVEESEQTSLVTAGVGSDIHPPTCTKTPHKTAESAPPDHHHHNTSKGLAQNGGIYLQKYGDTASYYYSRSPQNMSSLDENTLQGRSGNPPDVCAVNVNVAVRSSQQETHQQILQQCQGDQKPAPLVETRTSSNNCEHQAANPPFQQAVPLHQQSLQQQQQQYHQNQHQQQLLQQKQQQQQEAQKETAEYASIMQQYLNGRDREHSLPTASVASEVPRGYATVGPRRQRHLSSSSDFSTLQRPSPTRSIGNLKCPLEPQATKSGHHQEKAPSQAQPQDLIRGGTQKNLPHHCNDPYMRSHHPHPMGSPNHSQNERSVGVSHDDSGSSGYGGSPRQEAQGHLPPSATAVVSTPAVTCQAVTSCSGQPSTGTADRSAKVTSTSTTGRRSRHSGNTKTKNSDTSKTPSRETSRNGVTN